MSAPLFIVASAAEATTVLRRLSRDGWNTRQGFAITEGGWDVSSAKTVRYGRVTDTDAAGLAVLAAARGAGVVCVCDPASAQALALAADLARIGPVGVDPVANAAEPDAAALPVTPEQAALLERLADGETIAAAAEAEFLSLRTANRRIAAARKALGVATTREAVLAFIKRTRTSLADVRRSESRTVAVGWSNSAQLLRQERPVGVLTDYFRAADTAAVVRAMEAEDGGPLVNGEHSVFDGVEAKGVDTTVVLGALIAAIRQVPWSVDLVAETMVWPTTPTPGPDGPADEDDPWASGPWVSRLDPAVRDALADARDAELPEAVAQWVRAEELRGADAAVLLPLARSLVALARRARDEDRQLYCWVCL